MRGAIRVEDTFCRYGGEEFSLFMPNTDAASALTVVERIQRQFAAMDFRAKQEQFHVTFSCGISEIRARRDDPDGLIEDADQALYASKHAGRNQTTLYNEYLPAGKIEQALKVIVVDDDALIRRIVVQQFRDWEPANMAKVEVSSFVNGVQFLESDWYSPEDKFIVMLDGVMPELDGLEVLERLRRSYPEVNILVVMLTGRNNQQDIIHALQMGADDYIIKPFHLPELLMRVERLAHRFLF
ncbi:Response regulator PleD [compost metagenome]